MNMAGVNPGAAGGPVGGNMVMMNNGSPAMAPNVDSSPEAIRERLNTYVYEYLVKSGLSDVARALLQKQDVFKINVGKGSPNNRKSGEANGVDTDGMDIDTNNDFPDDLPRPQIGPPIGTHGFLFEWFSTFHDLYQASQSRVKMGGAVGMGGVAQYLSHTQGPHRMREIHQAGALGRPAGMNNPLATIRGRVPNGVPNGLNAADARKTMTPQQLQTYKMMTQNNQQQISREQGDVDMNGRPGTPADGDNGGSPSKRPRLENQQFNNGMVPNGRPMQGGPPQGMMIQNPFHPQVNQTQFRPNGAMGQKPMPPNMANGMNLMNSSGSPMMPGMNQAQYGDNMALEMYNTSRMGAQPVPNAPGANNNGNHALQDYQMQLMLLEQQNKKRLMMARQEQDNAVSREGGPMPMGVAPGMSPSGSRSGASPNPSDQLKRAAHMSGLPASPAPGENIQGRSPAGMFMNGMPPNGEFNQAVFMGGEKPGMGGPGGPGMRPPTSMNMGQQSRMAQPMLQNPSQQGSQQPIGTPTQRNDMPPPQAPAGGSAQRNQPPSPAPSSTAPPTPSQTSKPAPKGKKAKEAAAASSDSKKKTAKKAAQNNAGGGPDNEPPATPTPSTPITPQHPNSFNGPAKGQPGVPNNAQAQVPQMPQQAMHQQPDMGANFEFADNHSFNLDFSTLDSTDVLENFDFDSFLNTSTDEPFNFNNDIVGGGEFGLETGE